MKKSLGKLIIMLVLISFCFNCLGDDSQKLNNEEIALLNSVMKEMIPREERMEVSFLVNPYFGYYEFNSYFKRVREDKNLDSISKQKILKEINLNQESFKTLQKEVNNKYRGHFYNELFDLSKTDSSNWVITFSGINKDLFFIEIVRYCDIISKESLKDQLTTQSSFKAEIHSLFILTKNYRLKEIISGKSIHTEKCNEARK